MPVITRDGNAPEVATHAGRWTPLFLRFVALALLVLVAAAATDLVTATALRHAHDAVIDRWPWVATIVRVVQWYGGSIGVTVAALVVALLDGRRARRALALAAVVLAVSTGNFAVKVLVGRLRPPAAATTPARALLGGPLRGLRAPYQSFPSGHTACATSLAGVMATMYPAAALSLLATRGLLSLGPVAARLRGP